jgi:hypothetical protein
LPGFALNSAISSRTFAAGTPGVTTSTLGERITCVTGAKSRSMSYGRSA